MDPKQRQHLRDQVRNNTSYGPDVIAFLDANKLALNRFERLRAGDDYFAFLEITPQIKEQFGVRGDELLLLFLNHENQEQWFLEEMRRKLLQLRLSKSAVLILSRDMKIGDLCRQAYSDTQGGYKTALVALTLSGIRSARTNQERATLLYGAFKNQAFTIDHFDTRGPVPHDLFGRNHLLAQIENDLRQSNEGVALLGIRRVGKTSVLKRVLSQLEQDPQETWVVGYYDAQTDNISANINTVAAGLQVSLRKAVYARGYQIPAMPKNQTPAEQLRTMIEEVTSKTQYRIVLAIDEIEWLAPIASSESAQRRGEDSLRLFGLLRSLKQQHSSRVALAICGINETLCEMPQINGRPNPNLDWYRTHYVKLLSSDDTFEMLRELGERMGLVLDDEFLRSVWRAFGGHAYLARQFCSEAAKDVLQRPGVLDVGRFSDKYADFSGRARSIFEEILKHLAQFYENEYEVLRKISRDEQLAGSDGLAMRHLKNYGLVLRLESGALRITSEAFKAFASTHTVEEVRRERFKLLTQLGMGATGTVWKAWDSESQSMVALKVFTQEAVGNAAQAEMQLMQAVASKYTPRPIAATTHGELPVLAMELIEGRSLEHLLKERQVIRGDALIKLSYNLFASLESFHPEVARLRQLQSQGDLGPLAYLEYMDVKDGGYLHRDLKPANIIVTSEEDWTLRLIDFGLASPAQREGLSNVGTPDYMPPDIGVSRWDSTFDLYALGRIFWRCAFGVLNKYDEIDGFVGRKLGENDYKESVRDFFKTALNPSAKHRYVSVQDMRKDWDSALLAFI
ncbi:hypothetical protein ASNO1_78070 [Corallococcus caeni]|uniref:Protein kinase domain-containing protein n=2 Tax=Corallococcus caeni TaxID=3082388 RepID=A0ABQ6R5H4_9BACT|nr:hypothetical protein ASNO1_78070 [Corallococcus sp. NO1]